MSKILFLLLELPAPDNGPLSFYWKLCASQTSEVINTCQDLFNKKVKHGKF